jgi:hypothetical protein
MLTPTARTEVYKSVSRRSFYLVRQRQSSTEQLSIWLVFTMKVVVIGAFAFGCGFLLVVVARAFGVGAVW